MSTRTGDWAKLNDIALVKRLLVLLTQAAAGAPTAAILLTSLGGTIVWARTGAGTYTGTLAGAFPANKTVVRGGVLPGGAGTLAGVRTDNNTITLETRDAAGTLADGLLTAFPLEIEVYP